MYADFSGHIGSRPKLHSERSNVGRNTKHGVQAHAAVYQKPSREQLIADPETGKGKAKISSADGVSKEEQPPWIEGFDDQEAIHYARWVKPTHRIEKRPGYEIAKFDDELYLCRTDFP